MTPTVFDSCLGWIHPGSGSRGAILCAPLGHESMNSHRGIIEIAEKLSIIGFHVLRYDYPGTGDSGDLDDDAERLDIWQTSLQSASRHLRSETGCEDILVIGFRLGATLALRASSTMPEILAVACIMPVVSGRSFARELRLLGNAWREANLLPPPRVSTGALEVIGETFSPSLLSQIATIDLRHEPVGTLPILLMGDSKTGDLSALTDHLEAAGCRVTMACPAEWSRYLQTSLAHETPGEAFDELLSWCAGFIPAAELRHEYRALPVTGDEEIPSLRCGAAIEKVVRFGSGGRLAGVLSTPARPDPTAPTVVMLNTGFGRRIGDGRMYVTLARRLAALGVPSLRMDVTGFGDSRAPVGRPAHPYHLDHAYDVTVAIDRLYALELRDILVVGVCSSAHTAFHAALRDSRIREIVLVNLQSFMWADGDSLQVDNPRQRRPLRFYLRATMRYGGWRRIVRGEVRVASVLLTLLARPLRHAVRAGGMLAERLFAIQTSAGTVMRQLRKLDADHVAVTFVYSEGDPGMTELSRCCGSVAADFHGLPHVETRMLPAADHALLDRAAREQFLDWLCDRVGNRGSPRDRPSAGQASSERAGARQRIAAI